MANRSRIAGVLVLLAAVATVAALTDPHVGSRAPRVVLALDRSASIDPSMRATEGRWLAAITAHPGSCAKPCRIVTFASSADALPLAARALADRTSLQAGMVATDLERGIAAAVAAAPDGGRVVALSDGAQTEGDATGAVAAARARHVTIDLVLLADPGRRDAALTRLVAPSVVRQGDTVPLLVTVRSTDPGRATLLVQHDGGRVVRQRTLLRLGDNPLTLAYTAAARGWHSFRVQVQMPGDQRPENDALSVSVDVGAAPHIVVVSSASDPAIATILQRKGIHTDIEAASELPLSSAGYSSTDAVVLDDLPATALSTRQISALSAAVRDGGLGLLTLGGRHAYSLGGYAHSALDKVLPLASLVPGDLQRRNLALELVLDRSGSMSDTSRGVPKIAMAQSAATQAADFAHTHADEFGVVAFDIGPHVLLSLRRVTSDALAARVDAQIGGLRADGGTDIYLALRSGYRQILASSSPNRHIILLTDGISQPHTYTALLAQLKKHHITVATVALGTNVDSDLLRRIAAATGGNSYETANARDLPRIFIKETRLSARPVQISGRQRVVARSSSPLDRSLAGTTLPPLDGNVVTRLQVGAQLVLVAKSGTATGDPALAEWGFGLGRVVSWTPGLGPPWARAWTAEGALWNDVARDVARGLPAPSVHAAARAGTSAELSVDLGALAPTERTSIAATLEGPGSSSSRLLLQETAPSHYTAPLPTRAPGSYGLSLDLPAALGGRQRVLVDVPYPAEYLPTPAGRSTLAEVATQAGGRLLPSADEARTLSGSPRSLRTTLLVLALVLFLLSVATRLLVRSSRPARTPLATTGQREAPSEPPLTRR